MTLFGLLEVIRQKELKGLTDFFDFHKDYINTVMYNNGEAKNAQATIVSQNDDSYCFFQYKDDGHYCVTRPVNRRLYIDMDHFDEEIKVFSDIILNPQAVVSDMKKRTLINRVVYSCQQSIGCTLDALNNSNTAKKQNGAYFEILIKEIVKACGIDVTDSNKAVKIIGKESLKFERDIVLLKDGAEKALGQLKTTSKDRVDKIFLDKVLYKKYVDNIPYFLIVLNDVQRSSNKSESNYKVSSTFLPGHFKAYTMALDPLDGAFYVDPRQQMLDDDTLSKHIFSFDKFIVEDMWKFIE